MAKAVVVPTVPPQPSVMLTLTWDEAVSLRRMVGAIGTGPDNSLRFSGYIGGENTVKTDRMVGTAIYNALVSITGLLNVG